MSEGGGRVWLLCAVSATGERGLLASSELLRGADFGGIWASFWVGKMGQKAKVMTPLMIQTYSLLFTIFTKRPSLSISPSEV